MSSYIVTHDFDFDTLQPTGQKLDHVEFPGVTTILKTLDKSGALIPWALGQAEKYILEGLPHWKTFTDARDRIVEAKHAYNKVSEKALDIGSVVHDQLEAHVKAKIQGIEYLPPIDLPLEVKRCLNQFYEWEKVFKPVWIESESKIVNPAIGYAGTLDALLRFDNDIWSKDKKGKPKLLASKGVYLIDFKTSKAIYPEYALQESFYKLARETMSGEYLFEHEFDTMENGVKTKAYTSEVKTYQPIQIDFCGVLRFNKDTDEPAEWKDVSDEIPRKTQAAISLVDFYYNFQNRRLKNNPFTAQK